jgi:hypothetical protein
MKQERRILPDIVRKTRITSGRDLLVVNSTFWRTVEKTQRRSPYGKQRVVIGAISPHRDTAGDIGSFRILERQIIRDVADDGAEGTRR